ncbi:MAG: hypothetical protein K9N47_19415 [Prosthecobacter sp.]|uniref:hypothetical protein n=1 Tax=Prosthecobacter sp. TaxID=1965333 RepID=UPI0025E88315|nr:hypothetical protein [Prosthecobacter sp.]MCF7788301.1 hypothetical protein [Prosthecobacter sp.]
MDEDLTLSDSEKPRYLLPEGCRDLYDVIRLEEREAEMQKQRAALSEALTKQDCLTIPDPVKLTDLAAMLLLKPYQLISVLIKLNIFTNPQAEISFEIASKICARLGVETKRENVS